VNKIFILFVSVMLSITQHSAAAANSNLVTVAYQVRNGDTIWGFSNVYLIGPEAWKKVVSLNNVDEPKALQPGRVLKIPHDLIRMLPQSIEVISLSGDVSWRQAGGSARTLQLSDQPKIGDSLTVGASGRLLLRLGDSSIVEVMPRSEIAINRLDRSLFKEIRFTDILVVEGRINANVSKQMSDDQYRIKSRHAIAGVRGTEFNVGVTSDSTNVSVQSGSVAVSSVSKSNAAMSVARGEALIVNDLGEFRTVTPPMAPAFDKASSIQIDNAVRFAIQSANRVGYLYKFQLSSEISFTKILKSETNSSGTWDLDQLETGRYFVRVQAIDELGLASEYNVLMVDRIKPEGQKSSAYASVSNPREVGFEWIVVGQAKTHKLSIFDELGNVPIVPSLQTQEGSAQFCCLKPGKYRWQVDQFDEDDVLVNESSQMLLTVGAEPVLPKKSSARNAKKLD